MRYWMPAFAGMTAERIATRNPPIVSPATNCAGRLWNLFMATGSKNQYSFTGCGQL
jgi:hypothetical protein